MKEHCCERMEQTVNHTCHGHTEPRLCPDQTVCYIPQFDEYGLIVHDGSDSYITISFCPWCGTRLPQSKRNRWFEQLAQLGYTNPLVEDVPEAFTSDAWYRSGDQEGVEKTETGRVNICWTCAVCGAHNRANLDPFPGEEEINWAEDAVLGQKCPSCGEESDVCLRVRATNDAKDLALQRLLQDEPEEMIGRIKSRTDFLQFVHALREQLTANPAEWENRTLEDYLEALAAWTEDMDGYLYKAGKRLPRRSCPGKWCKSYVPSRDQVLGWCLAAGLDSEPLRAWWWPVAAGPC